MCVHAKSLQLCPTLLQPYGLQLTRLVCPPDSLGKNTEVGSHPLLQENLRDPGIETRVSYISCMGRQVLYDWHHLGGPTGKHTTFFLLMFQILLPES